MQVFNRESVWIIRRLRYSDICGNRIYETKEQAIKEFVKSQCHPESDPRDMNFEAIWERNQHEGYRAVQATIYMEQIGEEI